MKKLTRRQLLSKAIATAATVTIVPSCCLGKTGERQAPSDTLYFAKVGCGGEVLVHRLLSVVRDGFVELAPVRRLVPLLRFPFPLRPSSFQGLLPGLAQSLVLPTCVLILEPETLVELPSLYKLRVSAEVDESLDSVFLDDLFEFVREKAHRFRGRCVPIVLSFQTDSDRFGGFGND